MSVDAKTELDISDPETRRLLNELLTRRAAGSNSPAGLAWVASGGRWEPARHLKLLSDRLQAAAAGEIDRLMVFMPPRHGKSELISKYTPAWLLGRYPDRKVTLASYE